MKEQPPITWAEVWAIVPARSSLFALAGFCVLTIVSLFFPPSLNPLWMALSAIFGVILLASMMVMMHQALAPHNRAKEEKRSSEEVSR